MKHVPAVSGARTPSPTPNERIDLTSAETRPLGTERLILVGPGPFNPDAHKGHKMAAKGLLIKDPKGNRLNVTSLEMVSATCK